MEFEVLRSLAGQEEWALAPGPGDAGPAAESPPDAGGALAAPVPLHLDEEVGAVITTRCGGDSLRDLAAGSRGRPGEMGAGAGGELRGAFRRSGEWLRRFQERDRTPGRSRDLVDDVARRAAEDVDGLTDGLLGAGEARALRHRLDELRTAADAEVSPALRHGDFRLDSVRVGEDGRVTVVDFERTDRGYPPEDPARFLASLSLRLGSRRATARVDRLAEAFLEGYGSPGLRETPGYELCLRAVAARLLRREAGAGGRSRSGGRSRPGGRRRRRTLLSMLRGEPA